MYKTAFLIITLFLCEPVISQIDNPDFENGQVGWIIKGCSLNPIVPSRIFTAERVRDTSAISFTIGGDYWRNIIHPIGNHDKYLLSTFGLNSTHLLGEALGDSSMYLIESNTFQINNSKLYFLIGGTGGSVELWIADNASSDFYLWTSKAPLLFNKEVLTRTYFNLDSLLGKTAKIKIVDNSLTSHINVDDFYFSDSLLSMNNYEFSTSYEQYESPKTNKVFLFDTLNYLIVRDTLVSLPMWGFTDTHAHWMNHAGFGQGVMFGRPYGDIKNSLRDCSIAHANLSKKAKYYFYESENNHWKNLYSGYPSFEAWPNFASKFHQSMYIDWVKRVYHGGLRLLVCMTSNSEAVAKTLGEIQGMEDTTAVRLEIDSLKAMIDTLKQQNETWLEIVTNSDEAKRVILKNKLAVLIGMEIDKPGGWASEKQCNKDSLKKYLDSLKSSGVTYIFPIHISNNAFGGFSIYDSEHFSINNFYTKRNIDYGKYVEVDSSYLVNFRLGNEYIKVPEVLLANFMFGYNPPGMTPCGESDYTHLFPYKGHVNKMGLTDTGKFAINEMMNRGMIIDIDHMSFKSNDETILLAEKRGYPLIAGHTNFLNEAFDWNLAGFDSPVSINKLRNEHAKTDSTLLRLEKLGGMVCPITEGGKDVYDYSGSTYSMYKIKNDNPGSSETWAQTYLYALDKMKGTHVGFGTDMNGYLTEIAPRFGTFSAFSLKDDKKRQNYFGGKDSRKYLALSQENGVRYTDELKYCTESKFRGQGVFNKEESKILRSIFIAHCKDTISFNDSLYQFVQGFKTGLGLTYDFSNTSLDYKAAYFVSKHYRDHPDDSIYNDNLYSKYKSELGNKLDITNQMYLTWMKMHGNNIPLKRCEINTEKGIVDFDFNIDGLAQYGLIPDFIQDLKNIGLTAELLTPLFNSAADLTDLWKKCEMNGIK